MRDTRQRIGMRRGLFFSFLVLQGQERPALKDVLLRAARGRALHKVVSLTSSHLLKVPV